MTTPFFSVIITTFNRADLFREALASLARQSFADYEAFIIDDGSTDDTPAVFREFSGRPGWHFHRFDTNRRQAFARNFSIEKSSGAYITFLDADDYWLPQRLERFKRRIEECPGASFIFSNGSILQDGAITSRFFDGHADIPEGKLPPWYAISDLRLPYVTTNVAIRRDVLEKTGLFRLDMSHLEDMELYTKVLQHGEAAAIREPLSVYRVHALSDTPASLTLKWDDGIKDFLTALDTARPPARERQVLVDYVYLKQAVIYLKNGMGDKAREYLAPVAGHRVKMAVIRICSRLPRPLLMAARALYRWQRRVRGRNSL